MSNSIWHKKHVFVVDKNGQVVVKLDDGTYDIVWVKKDKLLQDVILFGENGIKFIEEYCYIDDLITQADKVERLQKAVDLALDTLKKAETTRELTVKGHYVHAISLDELHSALKEIKQLTQGNK